MNKIKIFFYNLIFIKSKLYKMMIFHPLVRRQMLNPNKIPVIIINFNQYFYLEKLVNFLLERNIQNIVIIDNNSTYEPLLQYYQQLPPSIIVERMNENYGHMVFFEKEELLHKYGKGFFVVTDADIIPNDKLPQNFMKVLLDILRNEVANVNKVGFALKIDDIPDHYFFKKKVIKWEEQFWNNKFNHRYESYYAKIDTTFALYKPGYPKLFNHIHFLEGIRVAGNFTAKHGGWYLNEEKLTDEQIFYRKTATDSSSWLYKEGGELSDRSKSFY